MKYGINIINRNKKWIVTIAGQKPAVFNGTPTGRKQANEFARRAGAELDRLRRERAIQDRRERKRGSDEAPTEPDAIASRILDNGGGMVPVGNGIIVEQREADASGVQGGEGLRRENG